MNTLEAQLTVGLTPYQMIGIPIAILGAVLMSVSAMLQHRGVSKVDAGIGSDSSGGLGMRQFWRLLRRPSWVFGTLLIGIAIVCQLGALMFAPLVVVQPIGVVSLIVTTLITARQTRHRLSKRKIIAVLMSVLGIAGFVLVAATVVTDARVTERQVITVLVIAVIAVALTGIAFVILRHRRGRNLFYIIAGGVLYGFVATFAKVILARLQTDGIDTYTVLCAAGLLLTLLVGGYFVQTAYATGTTEMVIAGLTVVDPIVAVTIGIVVLGEVAGATAITYLLFILFGALAVCGVFLLESSQTDEEIRAARRHALGVSTNQIETREQ
ncbi:multidrug DMT transporter permease [Gulosibacter molinativorax]|uniref:Multidrug DMT transporter permease n=1 Tax=Gulosibacter molinativorax TaxID=256821 RepID=A0ABT7C3E2_9MICO|nr:multidrug DMT transporter permease [Gulosibacter molinativorax]QUY61754.1 Conserved membrane protein, putative transporter of the DMT family [Gulosibacter molinativorax]